MVLDPIQKESRKKVIHHLFTPLPQYCINKFWIACFSHTFLTKPQHQPGCCRNHACFFGMPGDKLCLFEEEFNTTSPRGKRSPRIPGCQQVNAEHNVCVSTNNSLSFVTSFNITCDYFFFLLKPHVLQDSSTNRYIL